MICIAIQENQRAIHHSIAREYNVSDNAIRKWCKAEKLPYRVSEIKSYSDEEWEKYDLGDWRNW